MVELRQTWDVKWLDGSWISFPFSMVETFENKQYLRLRPTNYSLAQLLSKNAASKNASFASSGELAKLVELRNEAASNKFYKGGKVENEDAEEDEQQNLFCGSGDEKSEQEEPHCRKRKVPPGDYTVDINVEETMVEVLVQGKRPARSDMLILMEPAQLACVFAKLQKDVDTCLNAQHRKYNGKERKQ